jgi:P4 family phage/plasmid primase-like protien
MSTSSLEKLTPLQHRARDVGITMTAVALHALGIKKWETATDEQCYAVIGDSEITTEQRQQDAHAKPISPSDVGKLPKAQHQFTDLWNANLLARTFGKKLIVVAGQFYTWAGTHWARDTENEAIRCAARLSQIVGREAKTARDKATAAYEAWQSAITPAHLELAKQWPRKHALDKMPEAEIFAEADKIAAAFEAWGKECDMKHRRTAALTDLQQMLTLDAAKLNRDPRLFNCLNGTVDLRSGERHDHDPEDYITFCSPVRYDPNAKAPEFMKFLSYILEDEDTVHFLQRWFGSCMTGDTRDQKWLMHHGPGGNGKGRLVKVLQRIMAGYSGVAPITLLTATELGREQHSTEIMTLWGKRMMTASEPDAGSKLRQAIIKQATGEDRIVGRYLYKDYVEFEPTHKIQMLTNVLPTVTSNERATWRRILVVRYLKKFGTPEEIAAGKATHPEDPGLLDKLQREEEGILAWLVCGALDWQRQGLRPSAAVIAASREYESEQDRIGQFLRARCELEPEAFAVVTGSPEALFTSYKGWCNENNFIPLGSTKFQQELLTRPGIRKDRGDEGKGANRKQVRGLRGIRLRSEPYSDGSDDGNDKDTSNDKEREDPKPAQAEPPASDTAAPNGAADSTDWMNGPPVVDVTVVDATVPGKTNGAAHATPAPDPVETLFEQLRRTTHTEEQLAALRKAAGILVRENLKTPGAIVDAPSSKLAAIREFNPKTLATIQTLAREAKVRTEQPK